MYKKHIQDKTTTSLIGTGKIKRRYYIVPLSKIREKPSLMNRSFYIPPREKRPVKKNIDFFNIHNKMIFDYWNSKGKPFTKHNKISSKTFSLAIGGINRAAKKHSPTDIMTSMDNCHFLFNASWFKFGKWRTGIKFFQLPDFFRYRKGKLDEIKRSNKSLYEEGVKSWFKEGLKGAEYLEGKYSIRRKDKNKALTELLKDAWFTYLEQQVTLTTRQENNLIKCADNAIEFAKINEHINLSAQGIIQTVDNMLNKWKNYKPKHTGWLVNDIFWDERLPEELVRFGTVTKLDRGKIKRL